ncbi:MAG: FAD-dependent oxidoreductase [Methanocorpusculum sp.]|nr:FAD-dependent oxidoreductase [Methanocorpusculum sp.]
MAHIVVVYSLAGCPHCKNVKAFLAKHNIEYTNYDVDIQENADKMIALSGQRGVPVIIIDGKEMVIGDDIKKLELLLLDAAPSAAPAGKADHELLILGAGAAGLPAAMYAGRKQIDTVVVGGAIGGMVNQSKTVENYPGIPDIAGSDLMQRFYEHAKSTGVSFIEDVALSIARKDGLFHVETLNGQIITARAVIAASGRNPRTSGAKGEMDFFGKGVAVCTTCDGPLYKNKTVAVVGGGNTALDIALELADIASTVHLIVRSKIRGDEILTERVKAKPNVVFHIGYTLEEIAGTQFVEGIVIKKKGAIAKLLSGEERIPVDGVFLGLGLDPNTGIFEGLVPMNDAKEIIVDENCTTSVPGFFAAGDATSVKAKQIASSAGEGVKALLSAYEYLRK